MNRYRYLHSKTMSEEEMRVLFELRHGKPVRRFLTPDDAEKLGWSKTKTNYWNNVVEKDLKRGMKKVVTVNGYKNLNSRYIELVLKHGAEKANALYEDLKSQVHYDAIMANRRKKELARLEPATTTEPEPVATLEPIPKGEALLSKPEKPRPINNSDIFGKPRESITANDVYSGWSVYGR